MPFSRTRITELQDILERKYGQKVTEKQAQEIGTNLVRYFEHLTTLHAQNQPQPP